jgi:ubiquinone/menaquinone biosynthesis C-methylase UbiE
MGTAPSQSLAPAESPQAILEATWAFAATQVVCTALELDLFTCLEEGPATLADLARETGSSTRGLRILLGALVGMKFLERSGERYLPLPVASLYLSKKSPSYLGGLVLHSRQLQPNWARLTGVVRTGRAPCAVESEADHGEFFAQFVGALHSLHSPAAAVAARELWPDGPVGGRRVLDVGGGSAVWSLAFARRDPQARVTVSEWPSVIERVTRKCVAREQAEDRYEYLAGNFRQCDFGEAQFDVGILGHICHSEGAVRTRQLLARVHRALKPGGVILIAEMLPDNERQTALLPLLFAVNMLVNTEEGDTFTFAEYRQWLEAAGFHEVRALETPSASPLIAARK